MQAHAEHMHAELAARAAAAAQELETHRQESEHALHAALSAAGEHLCSELAASTSEQHSAAKIQSGFRRRREQLALRAQHRAHVSRHGHVQAKVEAASGQRRLEADATLRAAEAAAAGHLESELAASVSASTGVLETHRQ